MSAPVVAVVDYGVGNLFSVARACALAGLDARITAEASAIDAAGAIILPGIGAFGDAMAALSRLDMIAPLREAAQRGTPILGVCLGMQLLMERSDEFGSHQGLGLIAGSTERIVPVDRAAKTPHVSWSRLWPARESVMWDDTLLAGVPRGSAMYFVHSFAVRPTDPSAVVAYTEYGGVSFCAALQRGSVMGFQCHPERSGPIGLAVYRNFSRLLSKQGMPS